MTFFNNANAYGYEINFNVDKEARTVNPSYRMKSPAVEENWDFLRQTAGEDPILTWVTLKEPGRELCTHVLTVKNGTWGQWGYLNWNHTYPNDDLPRLKEMSESNRKERKIYFATHVLDSQCHYLIFYYGTSWSVFWDKMRGFVYGFTWDPDNWKGLDSMEGLNKRGLYYPTFILLPGVIPENPLENESVILRIGRDVVFGSGLAALDVNEVKGEQIQNNDELTSFKNSELIYHNSTLQIGVNITTYNVPSL